MKDNRGFTLIELLAVVTVLGIIATITIYVMTNVLSEAKGKTYETTVANIEQAGVNYLNENSNKLFFQNNGLVEYQCVTVQNLIDTGYFDNTVLKSEVSENENVSPNDAVYITRDAKTKAITSSVFLKDSAVSTDCGDIDAGGAIAISVVPSGWSKTKDITINYNVKNTLNRGDYKYYYKNIGDSNDKESNNPQKLTVDNLGIVSAKIVFTNIDDVTKAVQITKIDNVGPSITVEKKEKSTVHGKVTINLSVDDYGIGLDKSTFTIDDLKVYVGSTLLNIRDNKLELKNKGQNSSGNNVIDEYELSIENYTIDGVVKIKIDKDTFFDKLGNPNSVQDITTNVTFDNTYSISYQLNNGSYGASHPTSGTYNTVLTINKPTKTVTVTGNANGTGATVGAPASKAQTFDGWTANTDLDTSIAMHGPNASKVTTAWKNASTKVTDEYFKNLRLGSGTVALTANWSGSVNLPTVTKTGYTCGWNASKSGTTITYASGGSYTSANNTKTSITMYAVCIDDIAPTINISAKSDDKDYTGNWTNNDVNATVTFNDAGSGINASSLKWKATGSPSSNWSNISNTSTTTYTDTWSADRNGVGYYQICDKAGNCSSASFTVKIDKKEPTFSVDNYYSDDSTLYEGGCTTNKIYSYLYYSDSASGINVDSLRYSSSSTDSWHAGGIYQRFTNTTNASTECSTSKKNCEPRSDGRASAWTYWTSAGYKYLKVCDNAGNCRSKKFYYNKKSSCSTTPSGGGTSGGSGKCYCCGGASGHAALYWSSSGGDPGYYNCRAYNSYSQSSCSGVC